MGRFGGTGTSEWKSVKKARYLEVHCGGLVVSVLSVYSNDPSLNPAEVYNFYCTYKVLEELKQVNENLLKS